MSDLSMSGLSSRRQKRQSIGRRGFMTALEGCRIQQISGKSNDGRRDDARLFHTAAAP
jgi:hypothetical protein